MATKKKRSNEDKKALAGRRLNAFAMDPRKLVIIGLDTDDGDEHPLYDPRVKLPVDEALAKNINKNGVLETVLVRKDGAEAIVVAGRRRVRAARLANQWRDAEGLQLIEVPVAVARGTDDRMADIMVSENELRRDDGMDLKLKKLEKYMASGRSEEDAAIAFGVTKATMNSYLALLQAGPAVRKALDAGLMSATAAAKLAALPRAEQAAAVEAATQNGKATVQAAARTAKATANGEKPADAIVPPSKRLLRRMTKNGALGELIEGARFEDGFKSALMWVLGEMPAHEVRGLDKAIEKAGG